MYSKQKLGIDNITICAKDGSVFKWDFVHFWSSLRYVQMNQLLIDYFAILASVSDKTPEF